MKSKYTKHKRKQKHLELQVTKFAYELFATTGAALPSDMQPSFAQLAYLFGLLCVADSL